MMGSSAVMSSREITLEVDNEAVSCGSSVSPGSVVTVSLSSLSGSMIFEVSGASFSGSNTCSGSRSSSSTNTFTMPDTGIVDVWAGHASGYGKVFITGKCSLSVAEVDSTVECSSISGSCTSCLSVEGCAWQIGECLQGCQVMDVGCWSPEYFTDMTVGEICDDYQANEDAYALCSSKSDCSSCTLASESCMWFEGGWCGHECGMMGCGERTCPPGEDIDVVGPDVIDPWDENHPCWSPDMKCEECMVSNGCGWLGGSCIPSCDMIADAVCYSPPQTCEEAANDEANSSLCSSKTEGGCDECIATIQSDGTSPCLWFETDFFTSCGHKAYQGMLDTGPGVTTCSESITDDEKDGGDNTIIEGCASHTRCLSCLSANCAFTTDSCLDECEILDASCYRLTDFAGYTPNSLCELYEEERGGGFDIAMGSAAALTVEVAKAWISVTTIVAWLMLF